MKRVMLLLVLCGSLYAVLGCGDKCITRPPLEPAPVDTVRCEGADCDDDEDDD